MDGEDEMILPKNKKERDERVIEIVKDSFSSLHNRVKYYDYLKQLYYYGTTDYKKRRIDYNMIAEGMNTLSAFLYSGATTIFAASVNVSDALNFDKYMNWAEVSAEAVRDAWNRVQADEPISHAVLWSLILSTTFLKVYHQDGTLRVMVVMPDSIGVLNEYKNRLRGSQEAIVHKYMLPREDIEEQFPEVDLEQLSGVEEAFSDDPFYKGIRNILPGKEIDTSGSPSGVGGALIAFPHFDIYDDLLNMEESIEMNEAWIYDDEEKDYIMFTVIADMEVVDEVPASERYIKGRHPFVKITPEPHPQNFWGMSTITPDLINLQESHNTILIKTQIAIMKNFNPPKAVTGGMADVDSLVAKMQLNEESGFFKFSDPNAKVTDFKSEVPQEAFSWTSAIREMFWNKLGLGNLLKGRGDVNVRSRGQAELLSGFGSALLRRRATRIEESITDVATLIYRLEQKFSDTHLWSDKVLVDGVPQKFILNEMPKDVQIYVDSHSSSPLFAFEREDKVMALIELEVIPRDQAIDLLNISPKEFLKFKAKKKLEQDLQIVAQEQAAEAAKGK